MTADAKTRRAALRGDSAAALDAFRKRLDKAREELSQKRRAAAMDYGRELRDAERLLRRELDRIASELFGEERVEAKDLEQRTREAEQRYDVMARPYAK